MDGVFTDFVTGVAERHNVTIPNPWPRELNVQEAMGIEGEAFWASLDYNFWATLPKMHDIERILDVLREHEICVVTAVPYIFSGDYVGDRHCAAGKFSWMAKHYPQFYERLTICVSKTHLTGGILIDDSDSNVDNHDGDAILLPRPWNRNHRLNTIDHLRRELCKLNGRA